MRIGDQIKLLQGSNLALANKATLGRSIAPQNCRASCICTPYDGAQLCFHAEAPRRPKMGVRCRGDVIAIRTAGGPLFKVENGKMVVNKQCKVLAYNRAMYDQIWGQFMMMLMGAQEAGGLDGPHMCIGMTFPLNDWGQALASQMAGAIGKMNEPKAAHNSNVFLPPERELRAAAANARAHVQNAGVAEPDAEPESIIGKEAILQGLSQEGKKYNGKLGKVMSKAPKKEGDKGPRYVVKVYMGARKADKEISAKKENLVVR